MSREDTRNLKKICSLLHEVRRTGREHKPYWSPENIDELIETAERVYHERKGDG